MFFSLTPCFFLIYHIHHYFSVFFEVYFSSPSFPSLRAISTSFSSSLFLPSLSKYGEGNLFLGYVLLDDAHQMFCSYKLLYIVSPFSSKDWNLIVNIPITSESLVHSLMILLDTTASSSKLSRIIIPINSLLLEK